MNVVWRLIFAGCLLLAPALRAEAPASRPAAANFMRFVDDGHGGGTLQTAIVTLTNPDGVTVHLVAAVHVADAAYYQGLSKTFDGYDALLYELIKPKGAAAPRPGVARADSTVGSLQRWLKDTLDLEFQLDAIDYSRPNFVHADLDTERFEALQQQRGESLLGLMVQAMLRDMAAGDQASDQGPSLLDLLAAAASPDRPRQYKLLLGRQFDQIEASMSGLEGPNGTVLVTERNKKAVSTLKQEIAAGKKNIGIFFGAAHMSGIEGMMVTDMGFKEQSTEWRVAWDMVDRNPATQPYQSPLEKILNAAATRAATRAGEP